LPIKKLSSLVQVEVPFCRCRTRDSS